MAISIAADHVHWTLNNPVGMDWHLSTTINQYE